MGYNAALGAVAPVLGFLGGDGEDKPPMWAERGTPSWLRNPKRLSDSSLLNQWEANKEASTLGFGGRSDRAGSRAEKLFAELQRRGVDTSGVDLQDFSSGTFNASDTTDALRALRQGGRSKAGGKDQKRNLDNQRVRDEFDVAQLMQERYAQDNENWVNQNIDPTFQQAQDAFAKLQGTNAISGTQEAALRTKIGEQIKLQEEGQLRRASSILGNRGLDPSSPAGAALAVRAAERADAQLNDAFRELGINVSQVNRQDIAFNAAAATQIATSRLAAHTSIMGDRAALVNMQTDVAALIDAMHQRDQTYDLMRQALEGDDGGGFSGAGALTGAASGAASGASLGPWGAVAGGVIGGVAGGFGGSGGGSSASSLMQLLGSQYGSRSSYGSDYRPGNGYNGTVRPYRMPAYDNNGNSY